MATATLTRPQQNTGTWSAIFPTDQVTEQQSALFVKKLLAVAISNITYLRNIFPEHAFGDKCLEELNLKILRDDSSCPGACQVIKWVKGCFDALDKKYLRMLVVGIYVDPDDPETVIESYTFKFSYKDDGGIDIYRNQKKVSSAYGAAETKGATIMLLRTIIVLTQTLKSLPNDVMMTMKLLYYDDVTPADYEPPGFRAAESEHFRFEQEPMAIKVGDVSTPFHTVKMRIKTDGSQFELKDDAAEAVVDDVGSEVTNEGLDVEVPELASTLQESESGKDIYDFKDESQPMKPSLSKAHHLEPMQCNDVPEESPMKPQEEATLLSSQQTPRSEVEQEDYGVKCACGCNEDDGLMILCSVCKYWQHGVCFKVLSENEAPTEHICNECSQANGVDKPSTDPYLDGLSTIAVQATCLWRRALVACTETTKVLAPLFSKRLGVEVTVAQGLINRLEKEGYLKNPARGKKLGKIVMDQKIMTDGYAKYFKQNKTKHVKQSKEQEKEKLCSKSAESVKSNGSTVAEMEMGNKENEVDKLAEKTKSLSLSKQKRRKGDASAVHEENQKNKKQLRSSPMLPPTLEDEPPVKAQRGRKRAISKVDGAAEFEISDSQEVESCSSRSSKKASIASRAIMV